MKRQTSILWLLILFFAFLVNASSAQESKVYSLDDCIKISLKNNTDIVAAKSDYSSSKADLQSAWGNFMPSVSTYANWRRRSEDYYNIRFNELVSSKESYAYQFSVSQPLFTGFANYASLKQSRAVKKIYDNLLTWTEQQTVLKVKLQYYAVLKAKHLLTVAEETLKTSKEELVRIETMEQIGSISKAEVFQQKVRVGENQLALIEAQNNLSNAKADLNYTLGIDVNSDFELEEESLEVDMMDFNFDELIEQALKNRLDYKASSEHVLSRKAGVTVSRSGYYPQLSMDADYSWWDVQFPQKSSDLTEFDTYSVGVSLSMSIFNGFQTKSNVQKAKAQLISAEAQHEQTKRQVYLDIKKAILEIQKAAENIEVTNENLIASEEDFRFARERYRIGAGTLLEQITAEMTLTRAKANRIQALYDYKYAITALDLAVGNLKVIK